MKPCLLIASLLAFHSAAWPQEPEKRIDATNVAVDVQCVSLPQAQALYIARKLRSPDRGERAQAMTELDTMVAKETATLVSWLNLITHPEIAATAEETDEVRYATEFEAPSKTYNFADTANGSVTEPKTVEAMAAMATAFDTRNTGFAMEVKPGRLEDRRSLRLEVVVSHTWVKAMEKTVVQYENAAEKRVEKTTMEQPRFMVNKVKNDLTMESGDHQLIGLFRAPEGKNQFELFILGVEIREQK